VTGESVQFLNDVRVGASGAYREMQLAVNPNSIAFVPANGDNRLALVDRAGRETLLPDSSGALHRPRFSPDGSQLSFDVTRASDRDVWLYDFAQRTTSRVSFEPLGHDAIWAPDGRSLLYTASVGGIAEAIFARRTDGSTSVDTLGQGNGLDAPEAVLPDGSVIAYRVDSLTLTHAVILKGRAQRTLLPGDPLVGAMSVSPDRKWLAWVSHETGQDEVYARAVDGGPRMTVSVGGGREPVWAASGRELFYRSGRASGARLMEAHLSLAPLRVLSRDTLFSVDDYEIADPHANYDVMRGDRFVFIRQFLPNEIRVIRNWKALLKR
jgi:Tol biopolymer transport system component